MSGLALLSMAGFAAFLAVKQQDYSDAPIYPLSAAVILFVALAPAKGPLRVLRAPPLVWLGKVSYSVYMVHAFVLWTMNQVIRFGTHASEVMEPLHPMPVLIPGDAVGLIALPIALALVLLVSHFTYTWIEKPFRDWSQAAWRPKPAATITAASFAAD
jgi:peptidoglycan/LPS O-acetylase OafA/YrhL